jgi:membrane-associated protease RseP (regulator of RpoE activity)
MLFNYSRILIYVFFTFPGVGVYISRVEEGSIAERAGLRPGDSILQVNGTPFTSISHEEALKVTFAGNHRPRLRPPVFNGRIIDCPLFYNDAM